MKLLVLLHLCIASISVNDLKLQWGKPFMQNYCVPRCSLQSGHPTSTGSAWQAALTQGLKLNFAQSPPKHIRNIKKKLSSKDQNSSCSIIRDVFPTLLVRKRPRFSPTLACPKPDILHIPTLHFFKKIHLNYDCVSLSLLIRYQARDLFHVIPFLLVWSQVWRNKPPGNDNMSEPWETARLYYK